MYRLIIIVLVLLAANLSFSVPAFGFDIVGDPPASVVIPDFPSPVEQYAAQELIEHVRLATGVELPLVHEVEASRSGPRIYVGEVTALPVAGIIGRNHGIGAPETIPDDALSPLDGDTLRRLTEPAGLLQGSPAGGDPSALEIVVDLGEPRRIAALAVRNRVDSATNYVPRHVVVEVGEADDGKTFGQVVFDGVPAPGTNQADVLRRIPLGDVTARYLLVRVSSNMWGDFGDGDNDSVQMGDLVILPRVEAREPADDAVRIADLPHNGFVLRTVDEALYLVGRDEDGSPLRDDNDAGTLFAVYEWLDRQVGVRWLWPGELGTYVPVHETLSSGDWDLVGAPPFVHTRWRLGLFGRAFNQPAVGGFTEAQRSAMVDAVHRWYRRCRFARGLSFEYGHGFEDYWERFGETHPEYFNLLPDGTRRPAHPKYPGVGRLVSMCVSNRDFQRQVIADWLEERTPERPWINGCENDTPGLCVCENCRAWDGSDPESRSDRYAHFWLELQRLGEQYDPQATVIGYAYANYRKPPERTKLNERIVVGIVPGFMYPYGAEQSREFRAQWQGWHDAGASLYLRPNYMLSGHNQPTIFTRVLAADFSWAAQRGLIATDFDSLLGMWATHGPNIYLLTRLQWHPDWPHDRILDEYYEAFGPAAEQVRAYWEYWERISDERGKLVPELAAEWEVPSSWADFVRICGFVFTAEHYAQAARLLAAAREAAAGDERALARLEFLAAGLEDARLTAEAARAWARVRETGDEAALVAAVQALDRHRAEVVAPLGALNVDQCAWAENRSWDRPLYAALEKAKLVASLPLQWLLRWDPERVGRDERWFAQPGPDEQWLPVRTDAPWERQEVGKAWEAEHGAPYDGWAWYRISFEVPEDAPSRLALLFGAVDESAWVWLNGEAIGEHPFVEPNDWKTPFVLDITRRVRRGTRNELVVLVEDNTGAGGVWKPVYLVEGAPE